MTRRLRIAFALSCAGLLAACFGAGGPIAWREEVRLNDGRTIVIEHKERCDAHSPVKLCIGREHWVTLELPEFSAAPIVWHADLSPLVINVDAGKLYIVAIPPTEREYDSNGRPNPPYIGFVWQGGAWKHIPFVFIPVAIYDTNVFAGNAFTDNEVLTVARKESAEAEMRGSPTTVAWLKRIDPSLSR